MTQQPLILNRYRPIAEAGSGGFATVQVAWDTRIQRKVAIKCIELSEVDAQRAAWADSDAQSANAPAVWDDERGFVDPSATGVNGAATAGALAGSANAELLPWEDAPLPADFVSPFQRRAEGDPELERSLTHVPGLDEARTAALLTDANIVTVYDFEVQGSTAYLIMEYVDGMPLSRLLRTYGDRLTLDMVGAIFAAVSHALEVAHTNQVLHLDIKPDNILINRQGQVKVTDFGLATLVDAGGFGTAGGGTIGYMPLEQMRQESLDARCDEWALASVTYEMLTAENPFIAPNLDQAERAIENAEVAVPSLCWDGLDPEVDRVLLEYALAPDREERYENVTDFAEELEPFLGDPKRGIRELAMIVGDAAPDDEEDSEPAPQRPPRTPLRERISPRQVTIAAHVVGALGSALVGFIALANTPRVSGWDNPLFWGLLALVVLGGALKPHLGALLAYLTLALALFANGAFVLGGVLLVAVAAWWFAFGRFWNAPANTALTVSLTGAVGGSPLAPVAAGLCLAPLSALATTAFSLFVAIIFASFGSESLMGWNPLAFWDFGETDVQAHTIAVLTQPATWCIVASWLAAAVVQGACRLRVTRLFDVLGAVLSFVLLAVGACAAAWLGTGGFTSGAALVYLVPTGIVGALNLVLATQLPCEQVFDDEQ